MQKTPAPSAVRRRHVHLTEMALRGTENEQSVAREKLARLESRYYFGPEPEVETAEIFSDWSAPKPSGKAHPFLRVPTEWVEAGNLIKWIFQDQFDCSSVWRTHGTRSELCIHANLGDLKRLKGFASELLDTILAACKEFAAGRQIRELDRAPFLNGIYDGLMDQTRAAGARHPGYSPTAKKKPARIRTAKKSAPPVAAFTAIHPYDLGRDVGVKLRSKVPRDTLCESIRLAVSTSDPEAS